MEIDQLLKPHPRPKLQSKLIVPQSQHPKLKQQHLPKNPLPLELTGRLNGVKSSSFSPSKTSLSEACCNSSSSKTTSCTDCSSPTNRWPNSQADSSANTWL
jgi:hypothetical protein